MKRIAILASATFLVAAGGTTAAFAHSGPETHRSSDDVSVTRANHAPVSVRTDDLRGRHLEPGDDRRATGARHHRHVEANDDRTTRAAGRQTEVGDDRGTHTEVGDDRGTNTEVGDDRGTHTEVGDDRGTHTEVGDDRGTHTEVGDDRGGRHGGDDGGHGSDD